MTDLDDATTAAAGGDAVALEAIYRALAPTVRGYLAVHGSQDPDGLVNEVFVQVLPQISGIDNGWDGLRTLTFSVAHARLVDEHRQRARRPASREYDGALDARTTASAEHHALDRVAAAELMDVLELLPEAQRTVVVLRVLADLSVRQTAQVLQTSEPAVKKLQSKGLAALKALLGPVPMTNEWQRGQR